MDRKNRRRILSILLLLALVVTVWTAVPQAAEAFGDFDSSSDFGGSSGSSSDGGSSDFSLEDIIELVYLVSALLNVSPGVSALILIALVILLVGLAGLSKKHTKKGPVSHYQEDPASLQQLRKEDPAFDEAGFIERVETLFEKMDFCWENGNIAPLRKDFMPDTWTRFNTQLQNKNDIGETTHARDTVFDQVRLNSYASDARYQTLTVRLVVTRNIWTTDRNGKYTQGSEKTRKQIEYYWTMTRPAGTVTGKETMDAGHCPNCGAGLDLEAFAECPFCHTPIMRISPDWVIAGIDAVSQNTIHQ